MKLKYVKFSDERRREFCIKTIIRKENGGLKVYKEAIFEEGKNHIRNIVRNAELLKQYYDADICGVSLNNDIAGFDYIEGESMESRYIAAMEKGDADEARRLLLIHKGIILGKKENETVFSENEEVNGIFGDCSPFEGGKALRCCNYDAIASNILFVDKTPVFIDYEWVFDFQVPADIVLYHCIHNFYEHYPDMENLIPFEEAMGYLGVESDSEVLKKSYLSFYDYVTCDGSDEGFALMKAICLKKTQTLESLKYENIVNICECDRLQGVISDLNMKLIGLEAENKELRRPFRLFLRKIYRKIKFFAKEEKL